jgi:5'-methylthioadenosine phosphorylase
MGGREVAFLARHGYGHTIPPHLVNYRANLWALHSQGVEDVVSIASVGGIRSDLGPGVIAVPDQVLDYTWGRRCTFYEGEDKAVVHVDFTRPYCDTLRGRIVEAALAAGEVIVEGGVYAATQGPRLETAAEINRLERDGADMVGMTGMPEAGLARELGLCYAAIAVVANHAAGRGESVDGIRMQDINVTLQDVLIKVRNILEKLVEADGS